MKIVSLLIAALALTLALPGMSAANPPITPDLLQVQSISGPAFSGKLRDWHPDGTLQFTIKGQAEPRSLKLAELVRWGEWRKVLPGPLVHLHDGGFIGAEVHSVTDQQITVDSINGLGEMALPRSAVRSLVLQPQRWKHDKPEAVKDGIAPAETLILANGDRRTGKLTGWQPGRVLWQAGESRIGVPLSSVVAVQFPPQPEPANDPPKTATPRTWLGFTDGSRVLARSVVRDKDHWRIKLAGGGEIVAELDSLAALQPLGGRTVYLSDLPAAGYKSIPWLTTTWGYQRDRNVLGGELRVQGALALKGLGLHSTSRLTYLLDKRYERFAARVGIDDVVEGRGYALARIYGDRGEGLWELLRETPALRGGVDPVEIDLDVSELQRFALVVDFGGDGDAGDHVDWLDARVIAKP